MAQDNSVLIDTKSIELTVSGGDTSGWRRRRAMPRCAQRFAENVRLYLALGYRIDREEESALGVTVYMSKPVRTV